MPFIAELYNKFKNSPRNPYLRKVAVSRIHSNEVDVYFCGEEINPATHDLIVSAKQEVFFQFYIYQKDSQAGKEVTEALVELNEKIKRENKENNSQKKVKIKFLIDHRAGPAEWLTEKNPYRSDWLRWNGECHEVTDKNGRNQNLDELEVEYEVHDHLSFNSYHTKQIMVDGKWLMIRSGDIYADSNFYKGVDRGWTQVATVIKQPYLAKQQKVS